MKSGFRTPGLQIHGIAAAQPAVCFCLVLGAVLTLTIDAGAREDSRLPYMEGSPWGTPQDDRPLSGVAQSGRAAPGDTLMFGYVDEDGFAILGEVWTFDHGGYALEGWTSLDLTAQTGTYGRRITSGIWAEDPKNLVPAPILRGEGSAWIGAFQSEADALCWQAGLGYGDSWCQRLVSPPLSRDAEASVDLSWVHFNDTEVDYDYVHVYVELLPSGDRVPLETYTGQIGLAPGHPVDPPVGAEGSVLLSAGDFAGETDFRIVFEMTSDGSWSDEDGLYVTEFGPLGIDDVVAQESGGGPVLGSFDFESDLEGWSAEACPAMGSGFGVAPLSDYMLEDTCDCDLAGNVLRFHDVNGEQPYGRRVVGVSPPVDVLNDALPLLPTTGSLEIWGHWDQYSELPQGNGVFFRPGWQYYPWICEITGEAGWSPRAGNPEFFFTGDNGTCDPWASLARIGGEAIPGDAEQVRFLLELYASCDAFGIPPGACTNETNFTPLMDNVRILVTRAPDAPRISFELGTRFEDGFAQNTYLNDPNEPGRADVTRNLNFGNYAPYILGDSLQVAGPAVSSSATRWEARLWFRMPRVGPGADSRYTSWRDRVADGNAIDPLLAGPGNPIEFTYGLMDSAQLGTQAFRNKFASYFREDDDDFDPGAGELSDGNEIIADGVLFPGTRVEYFVSANYLNNPSQFFLLPDTSGGYFNEFEILPSWRDVEGVWKYPCFLYIDADNRGAQSIIEPALAQAGIAFDRFDYVDPGAGWRPPIHRGSDPQSTNGCTLPQLLGYRGIFVDTGTRPGEFWPEDYSLFSDYLTAGICGSDRRGMVLSGNGHGFWLDRFGNSLLSDLGASFLNHSYLEQSGDNAFCVGLEAPTGGSALYGTEHSGGDYVYGAYGSGCPNVYGFEVFGAVGTGVGNRVYVDQGDGTETSFAQVVNHHSGPHTYSYRTVLNGTAWSLLAGLDEPGVCDISEAARVAAAHNEIRAAAEWIYGGEDLSALCEDPCLFNISDVEGGDGSVVSAVSTRLHASAPNPFNPRTTLRFSLAVDGPASLAIFDVAGRQVRLVAEGMRTAGVHEVVWDGTDDRGQRLASGTYWARLSAGGRDFASRLVLLR